MECQNQTLFLADQKAECILWPNDISKDLDSLALVSAYASSFHVSSVVVIMFSFISISQVIR